MIRKFFSALAFVMMGAGVYAQLPDLGFTIDNQTAIVIVDPQNDFLSPKGGT